MDKFNQTFYSIKKVILEGISLMDKDHGFYIDLDIDTLNKKYVQTEISFDELQEMANGYNITITKLDNNDDKDSLNSIGESFRIESNDKQQIIKFLTSFINPEKLEEVCVWILRDDQISLDDDCMILDKSTLP